MPAAVSDAHESSAGHLHNSLTEKLDTPPTTPRAEDGRTNGNGDARREIENVGEEDTGSGEADSEDGDDDLGEEAIHVHGGHDHEDDGEEDEEDEEEDEEENEEEYEDEDEDNEEEEGEPSLKYERMSGSVNDLFKKDSVSALAVSNKCLVCPSSKCQSVYQISL
jgi:vacuolar protein sorting-associated protein 41